LEDDNLRLKQKEVILILLLHQQKLILMH